MSAPQAHPARKGARPHGPDPSPAPYRDRVTQRWRSDRQAADAHLAARIRIVHRESHGTYGVPRITAELRKTGELINHKRIARVMRRHRPARRSATAQAPHDGGGSGLGEGSEPDRPRLHRHPDEHEVRRDITYLPPDGGTFLYLATVVDLASGRLVGWSIADHMRTDLVIDALAAAERTRGSLDGAIMHTDHGAPYASRMTRVQNSGSRPPNG